MFDQLSKTNIMATRDFLCSSLIVAQEIVDEPVLDAAGVTE